VLKIAGGFGKYWARPEEEELFLGAGNQRYLKAL